MKTRIYNAKILTMEPDRPVFDGEIRIADGRISAVKPYGGEAEETDGSTGGWDQEIDAGGNLVMPGF